MTIVFRRKPQKAVSFLLDPVFLVILFCVSMETKKKRPSSLPPNYVTLAQLQERWIKDQRRKAEEEEKKQGQEKQERNSTVIDGVACGEEPAGDYGEVEDAVEENGNESDKEVKSGIWRSKKKTEMLEKEEGSGGGRTGEGEREEEAEGRGANSRPVNFETCNRPRRYEKGKEGRGECRPRRYEKGKETRDEHRQKMKNVVEKGDCVEGSDCVGGESDHVVEGSDRVVGESDFVMKKNVSVVEIEQNLGHLSVKRDYGGVARQIRVINGSDRKNRGYGSFNGGNRQFRGGYQRFNGENNKYRFYHGSGSGGAYQGNGQYKGGYGRYNGNAQQKGRSSGMVWVKKEDVAEGGNMVGNQSSGIS